MAQFHHVLVSSQCQGLVVVCPGKADWGLIETHPGKASWGLIATRPGKNGIRAHNLLK